MKQPDDSCFDAEVLNWLLDSDPAIRWQVMRDLQHLPAEVVAQERQRVAVEGWGARLLQLQAEDGQWGGRTYVCPGWTGTTDALMLLRNLGLDPRSSQARAAIDRVKKHVSWGTEFNNSPFFEGEEEACINGRVLALGAYFGEASDHVVERLLKEQLEDGGWNCDLASRRSSFHPTICVLEGLLGYEQSHGATTATTYARQRAQEYLLERGLFRRKSTGQVIDPQWMTFSFPDYWHYDLLRALDYFRSTQAAPDPRLAEAAAHLHKQMTPAGQWRLEHVHEGRTHFDFEPERGQPSRWLTLRALRVCAWLASHGARP